MPAPDLARRAFLLVDDLAHAPFSRHRRLRAQDAGSGAYLPLSLADSTEVAGRELRRPSARGLIGPAMSTPRNAKPVVVAGGGIGGLACALALAIKGFKVLVFEQAHAFGEIGAGIQLAPNAWSALDALGVGGLVKKEAVFIERLLLMDGISGETVIDIPLDQRFGERYGNPYAVTHRADIHAALLDGCKARPDRIELRTESLVSR